jgi:hypothetical protein
MRGGELRFLCNDGLRGHGMKGVTYGRRTCGKCGEHKPIKGSKRKGRTFTCADCAKAAACASA